VKSKATVAPGTTVPISSQVSALAAALEALRPAAASAFARSTPARCNSARLKQGFEPSLPPVAIKRMSSRARRVPFTSISTE
jgi:hypothetical protein